MTVWCMFLKSHGFRIGLVALGMLLAVLAYFIILFSAVQREDNPCSSDIHHPLDSYTHVHKIYHSSIVQVRRHLMLLLT